MGMAGYALFWYFLEIKAAWGHAHETRSLKSLAIP